MNDRKEWSLAAKLTLAFWGAALIILLTATEQSWISRGLLVPSGSAVKSWESVMLRYIGGSAMFFAFAAFAYAHFESDTSMAQPQHPMLRALTFVVGFALFASFLAAFLFIAGLVVRGFAAI